VRANFSNRALLFEFAQGEGDVIPRVLLACPCPRTWPCAIQLVGWGLVVGLVFLFLFFALLAKRWPVRGQGKPPLATDGHPEDLLPVLQAGSYFWWVLVSWVFCGCKVDQHFQLRTDLFHARYTVPWTTRCR